MRLTLTVTALCLLLPSTAAPQYTDTDRLRDVAGVNVTVSINDDSRCSVGERRLVTAAELTLRSVGIHVADNAASFIGDERALPHMYQITVLALPANVNDRTIGCALAMSSMLLSFESFLNNLPTTDPSRGVVLSFYRLHALTTTPADLDDMLERAVRSIGADLANEILKARQQQ